MNVSALERVTESKVLAGNVRDAIEPVRHPTAAGRLADSDDGTIEDPRKAEPVNGVGPPRGIPGWADRSATRHYATV